MAENILGLLFVSSTSRDRYVFRYPPDPTSPEARLQQPVYSIATYTAKDSTVDHKSHRLFPRHRVGGSRASGMTGSRARSGTHIWGSNASSGRAVTSHRGRDGSASSANGMPPNSTGSFHSHLTEVGSSPTDTSSSSDDSDFDRMFDGGASRSHTPRRYSSDTESNATSARLNAPKPFTEIVSDGRRGSVVESEATARIGSSKRGGGKTNAFVEAQYNYALGYSLDFLGDLLTPPRAACNRKFEVSVDELVFIGHPVCNTADGKWQFPSYDSDEDEDGDESRRVSRGRRMNDSPAPTREASLRPVAEHPESPHSRFERLNESSASLPNLHRDALHRDAMNACNANAANNLNTANNTNSTSTTSTTSTANIANGGNSSSSASNATNDNTANGMASSTADLTASMSASTSLARNNNTKKEEDAATLNMFHLVLIIDKPDTRPEGEAPLTEALNHLYREIAFKWTAAAYALQVKDNWVGKQVKELARIREKAIADGVPVVDCLRQCVETSDLAQSLHELFSALHKLKGKAINSHFSNLPTTVIVNVGSIPISIVLPPKRVNMDCGVALAIDSDSSDSDDECAGVTGPDGLLLSKQPHLRVEPWQTLLMLQDEESDPIASMASARETVRRNTRSQREEDELLSALIAACDITKPLQEIAHTLRFDLEGIVIPLARELVQSKRAILIDVISSRLRNMFIPTAISDHLRTLAQHQRRWNILFPKLPPLVQFVAGISMAPLPLRDFIPRDTHIDRETYLRAVGWLLKNDLVQQVRTRARVVASPAVKEAAWRRLWHRRRTKWLRKRSQSMNSKTSGGSRSTRPSFGAATVSSVSAITSPNSDLVTPRAAEQNPLDVAFASRVPRLNNVPPTPLQFPLDVPRPSTATTDSILDYDSDLEMDSDAEGDGPPAGDALETTSHLFGEFKLDESEPKAGTIPHFTSSFIFAPGRAQKDEARWLRVIREHNSNAVMQSRFDMCVQYFDGVTSFEEIMFRTGLVRRELGDIVHAYRNDLMLTVQP